MEIAREPTIVYNAHIDPGGQQGMPSPTYMFFKREEMQFFNTQKLATWKINFRSGILEK